MLTTRRLALACLALLAVTVPTAAAPGQERVAASFVLALGRTPTPQEVDQWSAQDRLPLTDLLARHRHQLASDAARRRAVIVKAAEDALGAPPDERDVRAAAGTAIYSELMQRHLAWLAEHPADYERVVHRAYRLVLQRDAYSVEIDYWKRRPAISFALLTGCVEDWARRNRPGLMATTGVPTVSVNSDYLVTVKLSPSVAAEARAAAGVGPSADDAGASAALRRVVAPGAAQITSVGGIHFAAAGAPQTRAARAIGQ